MALAFTDLTSGSDTTNQDFYTTGTFSPTGGRLLVVVAGMADQASRLPTEPPASVTTDITGLSNLTSIAATVYDPLTDGLGNLSVWAGILPATPGTGKSVTINCAADGAEAGCCWKVFEVSGYDDSGTAADAFVQAVTNAVDSTSTTATCTLASFADATNNATLAVAATPGADTLTPEAGYTAIGSQAGHSAPNKNVHAAYLIGEDTSPSFEISSNRTWGFIGLEVAVAGAGGTAHTKTVTDGAGLTDARARAWAAARAKTDTLGALDPRTRAVERLLAAEALGLTDSRLRDYGRTLTASEGLTDQLLRDHGRSLTSGLGLLDASARAWDALRSVTSDLGLLDSTTRQADYARALTDALGLVDDDTQTLFQLLTVLVTDALGLTDTASRAYDAVRMATEYQVMVDHQGNIMPPLSEWTLNGGATYLDGVVTLPDQTSVVSPQVPVHGFINWSLVFYVNPQGPASHVPFQPDGAFLLTSAYTKGDKVTPAFTDGSSGGPWTGNGNAQAVPVGVYTRAGWSLDAGNEVVYIQFTISNDTTYAGPDDLLVRDAQLFVSNGTPDSSTDMAFTAALRDLGRELTADLGLTDTLGRDFARLLAAEALGLLDDASPLITAGGQFAKTVSDALGLLDASARDAEFFREVAESLGLLDTDTRAAEYLRSNTDDLGMLDDAQVQLLLLFARTVTDTLGGTDATLRDVERSLADQVGLVDSLLRGHARELSDTESLVDALTRGIERALSESLGLLDSAQDTLVSGVITYVTARVAAEVLAQEYGVKVDPHRIAVEVVRRYAVKVKPNTMEAEVE